LGNFFVSVFNRESEFAEASTTQPRPCQFSSRDPVISEQIILKKVNNLNVTQSPGPDNIHPRILYELRYELAIPLKILLETSYNLGQLPADWKIGNMTAIFYSVRNARIASAVLATAIPSVRPSVRHTPVLCQNDGT